MGKELRLQLSEGFDAATVGAPLIALGQSAEGLRSVVLVIKGSLRRSRHTTGKPPP
jgi:hypothetical protein